MDIQHDELLNLFRLFQKHQVKYLVIGGFAVNRHGYNRSTGDINIYLKDSRENRQALIEAVNEAGYGRFDMLLDTPILAGYCEIMLDNGMYADLMTEIPGLKKEDFDRQYDAAVTDHYTDIHIRFIRLGDLVANKKATGRPKDLLDIQELEKINSKAG